MLLFLKIKYESVHQSKTFLQIFKDIILFLPPKPTTTFDYQRSATRFFVTKLYSYHFSQEFCPVWYWYPVFFSSQNPLGGWWGYKEISYYEFIKHIQLLTCVSYVKNRLKWEWTMILKLLCKFFVDLTLISPSK